MSTFWTYWRTWNCHMLKNWFIITGNTWKQYMNTAANEPYWWSIMSVFHDREGSRVLSCLTSCCFVDETEHAVRTMKHSHWPAARPGAVITERWLGTGEGFHYTTGPCINACTHARAGTHWSTCTNLSSSQTHVKTRMHAGTHAGTQRGCRIINRL